MPDHEHYLKICASFKLLLEENVCETHCKPCLSTLDEFSLGSSPVKICTVKSLPDKELRFFNSVLPSLVHPRGKYGIIYSPQRVFDFQRLVLIFPV